VWAMFGVQACIGQPETLDWPTVEEVFRDDFLYVADVNEAVPDSLGIDHDDRTVLTLVEATRLVGADVVLEASFPDRVLESGFEFPAAGWKAAGAGSTFVALIRADEDVMVEFRHCFSSLQDDIRRTGLSETIAAGCNLTILSRLKTTWWRSSPATVCGG
jgi:hypothetical protein